MATPAKSPVPRKKMNDKAGNGAWVGKRMKRKEDPRMIRGISHYTDDLKLAGMVYCAFARSPHAHAEIKAIRTDAAKALPGVIAVYTSADTTSLGPVPCAIQMPDLKIPRHPVLAEGRVRYVGEPVAVVVAEDFYTARDAAEKVEVEYEPLPVVTDMEKALSNDTAYVHDEFKSNQAFTHTLKNGNLEAAFKKADKVVKQRMINQRLCPLAMEPRAVIAEYLPGENRLTVWSSTQIPHLLKTQISLLVGLPETSVRVIAPEVGGGFGSKLNVYSEEGVVPWLSMKVGRPVKWNEGRRENFMATIHGRDALNDVELALKKDGTILGLRARVLADMGAYHQLLTPLIPQLTALMHAGCYKIPAIQIDIVGVFTNKMSTDAYRGAGRPEATYNVERIMDIAASELGKDPAQSRLKNFPQPKEFPFTTITGLTYDSAKYQESLKRALKLAGYDALRRRQKSGWKAGKYYGIGVSTYVEICAIGPSAATPAGGWESGTVRIEPTGKVTLLTGASPHGQGEETTFAQLIADELGIDPDDINVVHGDTMAVAHFFEPSNFTFPFGCHICSGEVDAETGEVKIDKYVAVDDCGNVINPLLVDGQIQGGIAQGLGQAMWEELIYNEDGQLVTGTLMDYALPKAHLLPEFTLDRTVTPSPVNPMGVKGVGEAGTIASTPCLVNAVCDALSPLGVRHIDMPLKPERVWTAIRNAQSPHTKPEPAQTGTPAKRRRRS